MLNAPYLNADSVLLDVDIEDQQHLFAFISQLLSLQNGVPAQRTLGCLQRREQVGSTAIGQGVVIPHARVAELEHIYMLYIRLAQPIPYDTPDTVPLKHVLALLVPSPAIDSHLEILSHVTRCFAQPAFREKLAVATHPQDVVLLFEQYGIEQGTSPAQLVTPDKEQQP